MIDKKRTICPKCNGDKTIDKGWHFHGHSRGHYKIMEECPLCKGEGIVIQKTTFEAICDQKPTNDTSSENSNNDQQGNLRMQNALKQMRDALQVMKEESAKMKEKHKSG